MNIVAQTNLIYQNLTDDLSRKIYENRLLHSLLTPKSPYSEFIRNIALWNPYFKSGLEKLSNDAKNNDIIFYGAGGFMRVLLTEINDYYSDLIDFEVIAIGDGNKDKWDTEFCGYTVFSPAELLKNFSSGKVFLATWSDSSIDGMTKTLIRAGFKREHIFALKKLFFGHEQYFDAGILPSPETEEVFVDAGCYDLTTSIQFAKWCVGKYSKILAFEPNPAQYRFCEQNKLDGMYVFPTGLWHESCTVNFDNSVEVNNAYITPKNNEGTIEVQTARLDDVLNGEKATFIKMDIEGAELNALKGAEQTILTYRPKLAISMYHKPEDMWEIPAYILSLHSDYRLYLRHYSFSTYETVLYAI